MFPGQLIDKDLRFYTSNSDQGASTPGSQSQLRDEHKVSKDESSTSHQGITCSGAQRSALEPPSPGMLGAQSVN